MDSIEKGFYKKRGYISKVNTLNQEIVILPHKNATGYTIPLGPLAIVMIITDKGMVGCGAFDVLALDRFGYPAARVRPSRDDSIATLDDLLNGIIKEANRTATACGIREGMPVREALTYL